MKFLLAIFLLLTHALYAKQDNGESGRVIGASGAPTITVGTNCVGSASTATTNCTLASSGAVGDLLVVITKTQSVSSTATATLTFSGTSSCASPTTVISGTTTWQDNGSGGHFNTAIFGCIITTAGATIPVVTWTGGGASFTDIAVSTYHTTNTWKTTFTDATAFSVSTTSTTSCPTGTTSATTNANDLVVTACECFDSAQTWGALSGWTNRASSSRNTTGWYDKVVTTTGTQAATMTLSTADYSVGVIAAFASN